MIVAGQADRNTLIQVGNGGKGGWVRARGEGRLVRKDYTALTRKKLGTTEMIRIQNCLG